jgi:hypothetical protein
MANTSYYFANDPEYKDFKSNKAFNKNKYNLNKARKLAKKIGYGYLGNATTERQTIHDAFCFYKTSLEKIQNNDAKFTIDYAVSCLINTITIHTIFKAMDS